MYWKLFGNHLSGIIISLKLVFEVIVIISILQFKNYEDTLLLQ